jgi:hypothetical protein
MKQKVTLMALLLVSAIFYWGCNQKEISAVDNTVRNAKAMEEFNAITQQIADAKAYFVSTVDTNVAQKFKKTAKWDDAFIAHYEDGDRVWIPLKYEKNYTFKSKFSGDKTFVLEKQSHLEVFKDKNNSYNMAVVTYMPNTKNLKNPENGFSGYIAISKWDDNIKRTYFYDNGKIALQPVKNSTTGNQNSTLGNTYTNLSINCGSGVDYYWCDAGWNSLSDCQYLFTTCANDFQSLNNPQDFGSSADSLFTTSPKTYVVGGIQGYWYVDATFLLKGCLFINNSSKNYFTDLPTGNSDIHYVANLPIPTYKQSYAISNWVAGVGNQGVSVQVKGDTQDPTFGHTLLLKGQGYYAPTALQ